MEPGIELTTSYSQVLHATDLAMGLGIKERTCAGNRRMCVIQSSVLFINNITNLIQHNDIQF